MFHIHSGVSFIRHVILCILYKILIKVWRSRRLLFCKQFLNPAKELGFVMRRVLIRVMAHCSSLQLICGKDTLDFRVQALIKFLEALNK